MKIVSPDFEVLSLVDGQAILHDIERCGRVCYKSEDKITETSAQAFVGNIIKRGHEAVLEHASVTVKFTVDRGVSHEIVRHRLAAYCFKLRTALTAHPQMREVTIPLLRRMQELIPVIFDDIQPGVPV